MIKIYSFCLKGKTSDVMKKVKILTRIEHPNEILNQESSRGKFIFKAYEKIKNHYDDLLKSAISNVKDEKLLVFTYSDDKMSFTGDLANELLYKFPDKIIIVARRKEDDMRMSIRSSKKIIPPILEKSLIGLEGYGGGHELACGANVKQHQFEEFVERMKKKVSD